MKVALGDLFAIGIDGGQVAVGQIVGATPPSHLIWVAIFWPPIDRSEIDGRAPRLITGSPVLLVQTFDAFLREGRWERHSNAELVAPIPWPAFRVATAPGVFWVVDHDGVLRRPASADEATSLPFRSTMSPAAVDMAVAALAGRAEWDEFFNGMRPGPNSEAALLGRN